MKFEFLKYLKLLRLFLVLVLICCGGPQEPKKPEFKNQAQQSGAVGTTPTLNADGSPVDPNIAGGGPVNQNPQNAQAPVQLDIKVTQTGGTSTSAENTNLSLTAGSPLTLSFSAVDKTTGQPYQGNVAWAVKEPPDFWYPGTTNGFNGGKVATATFDWKTTPITANNKPQKLTILMRNLDSCKLPCNLPSSGSANPSEVYILKALPPNPKWDILKEVTITFNQPQGGLNGGLSNLLNGANGSGGGFGGGGNNTLAIIQAILAGFNGGGGGAGGFGGGI